jgi:hypothetical protein
VVDEQEVALEPLELSRHLSLTAADDLSHCDLAVIVADPYRHTAEEGRAGASKCVRN